ncbi:unnamed protein product, partial [Protopolystoma xenopodis]
MPLVSESRSWVRRGGVYNCAIPLGGLTPARSNHGTTGHIRPPQKLRRGQLRPTSIGRYTQLSRAEGEGADGRRPSDRPALSVLGQVDEEWSLGNPMQMMPCAMTTD